MKFFKNLLAQNAYFIVLFLVKLIPARAKKNHLLLIKTDEIGDYVLMHSYLKYFKQSSKYKDFKITLVGNIVWKSIFACFDNGFVDNAIWLNKKDFKKNLIYRFTFLFKLRSLKTTDVINLIFSRSINFDDAIAWVATGATKIAMKGDNTNQIISNNNWDKWIYNEIIDAGNTTIFDVLRNRDFIASLLNCNELPLTTKFEIKEQLIEPVGCSYYILFLGAGNPERKWGIENFVKIANYINEHHDLIPIICGGPEDKLDGEAFINRFGKKALNYSGKTTLLQLMGLMSGAKFLLSVDTGAVHMAVSVNCPVIGLFSGKFYGRFAPYPIEITNKFYAIYPDFVDTYIMNNDSILYNTSKMKNNTINLIPVEKVIPILQKLL